MIKVRLSQVYPPRHSSIDTDGIHCNHHHLLTMNGEDTKDEDLDEANPLNLRSSSNSTTSNISCRSSSIGTATAATTTTSALRKQHQINRRRAFFHDDIIVTSDNHHPSSSFAPPSASVDEHHRSMSQSNNDNNETIIEESQGTLTNHEHQEENPISRPFKRKVVSFSTMPCEKKVADG